MGVVCPDGVGDFVGKINALFPPQAWSAPPTEEHCTRLGGAAPPGQGPHEGEERAAGKPRGQPSGRAPGGIAPGMATPEVSRTHQTPLRCMHVADETTRSGGGVSDPALALIYSAYF